MWTRVLILIALLAVAPSDARAQQQLFKLLASDGGAGDWFGVSVDIDGDLAVVGAYDHDHVGPGSDTGAAYLFRVSTGQQILELLSTDPPPVHSFGRSVGIDGNRVVVGAYGMSITPGAAYLFDATTGQQVHKLIPSDSKPGDGFGLAVAIDGNIVVVGTQGSGIYVFDVTTGQQIQKLISTEGVFTNNDSLGISGTRVIAGKAGAAFLFDAITGQQLFKLVPSNTSGHLVAIQGNRALIGGTVPVIYVFDLGTGQQIQTIPVSFAGSWVGLSSTHVFNGVPTQGRGMVESVDLTTALPAVVLTPTDSANQYFGFWGAVDGDKAVFGAIADTTSGGPNAGAAYLFDVDAPGPISQYGAGCAGTGGIVPSLGVTGTATPGGQIQIAITSGVGSGSSFILIGTQQASANMGFGCSLNVQPVFPAIIGPIPLFPFGAQGPGAGSISFPVNTPTNIAVPVTVTLQAFVVDSGSAGGFSNTNGVALNFQ